MTENQTCDKVMTEILNVGQTPYYTGASLDFYEGYPRYSSNQCQHEGTDKNLDTQNHE